MQGGQTIQDREIVNENGMGGATTKDKNEKHIKFSFSPRTGEKRDEDNLNKQQGESQSQSQGNEKQMQTILKQKLTQSTSFAVQPNKKPSSSTMLNVISNKRRSQQTHLASKLPSLQKVHAKQSQDLKYKLQEINEKKKQNLSDYLLYQQKIGMYGGIDQMAVDILMKSYKFLAQIVKDNPKDTIKLNIPETIVCGLETVITYLYTNSKGFLEAEYINKGQDDDTSSNSSNHSRSDSRSKMKKNQTKHDANHETLADQSIIRLAQIADYFHDKTYLENDWRSQRKKLKDSFYPIGLYKSRGDDCNNNSIKLFFANSIVEKIMTMHTREIFIVQRFVINKGMGPAIVRCEVNLKQYPQIDIPKTIERKELYNIKKWESENKRPSSRDSVSDSTPNQQNSPRNNSVNRSQNNRFTNDIYENSLNKKRESSAKSRRWQDATFSPVAKKFNHHNPPDKITKYINNNMSRGNHMEISLKIFKVSSKCYYNGSQLTERINAFQQNTENKKSKQQGGKSPRGIQGQSPRMNEMTQAEREELEKLNHDSPVIRLDHDFINYVVENNRYFCSLLRSNKKNLKQQTLSQKLEQLFQMPQGDFIVPNKIKQAHQQHQQHEIVNHSNSHGLSTRPSQASTSSHDQSQDKKQYNFTNIFYHKTEIDKVINKQITLEEYLSNDRFLLQNGIQVDLNDQKVALSKQFLLEEQTMSLNANVVETSKRAGSNFKTTSSLININDPDSQEIRVALNQLVKNILMKQSLLDKLVVDFCTEPTAAGERHVFLQMKFASINDDLFKIDNFRTDKPEKIVKDISDQEILELKRKAQKKAENEIEKKEQPIINKRFDFFLNTNSLIKSYKKITDVDQDEKEKINQANKTQLQYLDKNQKPVHLVCAGEYCKMDEIELDSDLLPEFHFDEIVKFQDEKEKKEAGGLAVKSFTPSKEEVILPDLPYFNYKVSNSLILLDHDIKCLWREQQEVSQKLEKLRTKNNKEIYDVYKDKLLSMAGKNYAYSSVEIKDQMKLVCYQCYVFYKALQQKIFDTSGKIKYEELHKISDPQYEADRAKEADFEKIKSLINSKMCGKIQTIHKKKEPQVAKMTISMQKKINQMEEDRKKKAQMSSRSYNTSDFGASMPSMRSGRQLIKASASVKSKQSQTLKNIKFALPNQVAQQNQDSKKLNRSLMKQMFGSVEVEKQAMDNQKNIFIQIQNNDKLQKTEQAEREPDMDKNLLHVAGANSDDRKESSPRTITLIGGKKLEIGQNKSNQIPRDNTLDVIFNSSNEISRPVKKSMPSIYEREKKMKLMHDQYGSVKTIKNKTGKPPLLKKAANDKNSTIRRSYAKIDFKSLTPIRQQRRNISGLLQRSVDSTQNKSNQYNNLAVGNNLSLKLTSESVSGQTPSATNTQRSYMNQQDKAPIDIQIETPGNTRQQMVTTFDSHSKATGGDLLISNSSNETPFHQNNSANMLDGGQQTDGVKNYSTIQDELYQNQVMTDSYIDGDIEALLNQQNQSKVVIDNFKNIRDISNFFNFSKDQQLGKQEWSNFRPNTDKSCLVDPRTLSLNSLLPYVDVARLDPQTKMTATIDLYQNSYKKFKQPKFKDHNAKLQESKRTKKIYLLQDQIKNQAMVQQHASLKSKTDSKMYLSNSESNIHQMSEQQLNYKEEQDALQNQLQLPNGSQQELSFYSARQNENGFEQQNNSLSYPRSEKRSHRSSDQRQQRNRQSGSSRSSRLIDRERNSNRSSITRNMPEQKGISTRFSKLTSQSKTNAEQPLDSVIHENSKDIQVTWQEMETEWSHNRQKGSRIPNNKNFSNKSQNKNFQPQFQNSPNSERSIYKNSKLIEENEKAENHRPTMPPQIQNQNLSIRSKFQTIKHEKNTSQTLTQNEDELNVVRKENQVSQPDGTDLEESQQSVIQDFYTGRQPLNQVTEASLNGSIPEVPGSNSQSYRLMLHKVNNTEGTIPSEQETWRVTHTPKVENEFTPRTTQIEADKDQQRTMTGCEPGIIETYPAKRV